ncbi:MAG: hypothetical protein ACD_15C00111G0007 [uncultured bacterium]|nr:MAG: hypothetical protein ACD_15C00111G0007 [uncultured bacterium]HCU71062.1 hypothetical protein [Candidatus Moranbacteria bacterium]
MFSILKTIIWIAGVLVVGFFVIEKMGYEVNRQYFSDSRKICQEKVNECSKTVLHQGIDNVDKCNFNCVDPQLIIKKK